MGADGTPAEARPARVLLHVEGAARGFKNALAFRRWLRRHGVPVLRDGKMLWVKRADVDAALDRMAAPPQDDAVRRFVESVVGGAK